MARSDTSLESIDAALLHTLRLNVGRFDDEHIRLAELLQAATLAAHERMDPSLLREELSTIMGYALMHFSEEESAMDSAGYPKLREHRAEHEKILERLQNQLANYDMEPWKVTLDIVDMLELWMRDHIAKFDADYTRFLRKEL